MSTPDDMRIVLIEPLEALGWPRPKNMTAKAWNTGKAMLADRLDYLDADQLAAVAADVLAATRQRRVMASAGEIEDRAKGMFPDPEEGRERDAGIRRWMTSAVGRDAAAGDYDPEMLAYLRRFGPGFHFAAVIVTGWQQAAKKRRASRADAMRRGDAELVARIDSRTAQVIAMMQGEGS